MAHWQRSLALFLAATSFSLLEFHGIDAQASVPWVGTMGVHQQTKQIMAEASRVDAARDGEKKNIKFDFDHDYPLLNVDVSDLSPAPGNAGPSIPLNVGTPQTFGVSFTGATLTDTRAFPPDTMGAVGPTQFIVAVNGRIRSFNKTTGVADGVLDTDTDVFFNSVMTPPVSNNFTSDPRIRYDRLSGRWFIIIIDVPGTTGNQPNRVMIAVSDSSVISASTVWSFSYFQHDLVSPAGDTGLFADYPTLGIDANALYIGVNVFGARTFSGTTAFVVRKSSLLGAGPIVVTAFRDLITKVRGISTGPYTPQGVDNYATNATEGYIIGKDSSYNNRIDLLRVSNPGGTPTISGTITITVPTMSAPQTVPHLGNTGGGNGNLDGLDTRLMAAHFRNGRLWTCQNVGVDNTGVSGTTTRNGVRWYEFQGIPTGQTPSIVQSGTVYQSSASNSTDQRNYWMGTVMVSGQGHAAMGFSTAGVNEYINAAACGRLASDPLGTMQTPTLYTASSTAYNPASDTGGSGGRRWGDYSYTSLDPSDDMTMWTIQEFCDSANSYGVRAVKLLAPPPATATNCNPNSILQGATSINVVVTGLSVSGSGFFDPGVGFSNHIAAAVNGGGVTVNSVTYTDPTHITLNVSVAPSAAAGARTITVTNPDGQAVTSSALLTITTTSNHAPVLATISNATINEGTNFSFTTTATDADAGQSISYSLGAGAPSGATINSTSGGFSWTPSEGQGPAVYSVSVIATDNGAPPLSDTNTFSITVNEVNVAPTLATIANRTVNEGATLTVTNAATDADLPTNTITFSLGTNAPAGMTIAPATGVLSWTPTEAQGPGVYPVSVIATDNGSPALNDTKTFSITVNEVNTAPALASITNRTVNEGVTLTVTNVATDSDLPTNTITFSVGTNAPSGLTIAPTTGVLTWTPTEAQGPGVYSVSVIATDDGSPALSNTKTFSITVNEVNTAPVLASITNQTVNEGVTLTITNVATDSDLPTNTITFSLGTNAPSGVTIAPTTGVLSWTPTEAQGPGIYSVSVIATDNGSPALSDTKTFSITVDEVNSAPVLAAISARAIHIGSTVVITNTATDSDVPANSLTFSLTNAPVGMAIDSNTGVLTWTPDDTFAGTTNTFSVRVTDNGSPNLSDTKSGTVVVALKPTFQTPTISNQVFTITWSSIAGQNYRVQFKSSLGDASWTNLGADVLADGATASATDTIGDTQRFYRVIAL